MTDERKQEIYWNIQLRTAASEYRLERLKADINEQDREQLIGEFYD